LDCLEMKTDDVNALSKAASVCFELAQLKSKVGQEKQSKLLIVLANRMYEEAIAADNMNVELMCDYATFLIDTNNYSKAGKCT
jgi:hypothetical protein